MSRTTLHRGRFLALEELDGWELVRRVGCRGVVAIAARTSTEAGPAIVLVSQHRPPMSATVVELPAGLAGDIVGREEEPLLEAARRELDEETGFVGGQWEEALTGPVSAGLTDETVTIFRAIDVRRAHEGGGDASEAITVHVLPLAELPGWLDGVRARGWLVDHKVYTGLWLLQQT